MKTATRNTTAAAPAQSAPRQIGRIDAQHAGPQGGWVRIGSGFGHVGYYFSWMASPKLNRRVANGAEVSFELSMDAKGRPVAINIEALDTLPSHHKRPAQ